MGLKVIETRRIDPDAVRTAKGFSLDFSSSATVPFPPRQTRCE